MSVVDRGVKRADPIAAGRDEVFREELERIPSDTSRWYETRAPGRRHRTLLSPLFWPILLLIVWVALRVGGHVAITATVPRWLVSGLVVIALLLRWRLLVAGTMVVGAVMLGAQAWHSSATPETGQCDGVVRLIDDPVARGHAMRSTVELRGRRYVAAVYGRGGGTFARLGAGEAVSVKARCAALSLDDVGYLRPRHVLGRMTISVVGDRVDAGSALARSARWVHSQVALGARTMGDDERSLFAGLVIGDDSRQPKSMIDAFRASGLGHLCAVSGQNVAYVLIAFGFVLRRLRPTARLAVTVLVVSWFVVVTRVEPSIVRAGAMAIAAGWNFHRGHHRSASDVLAVSSLAALFVDPMLAWSVGFLLSVAASLGLVTLTSPLTRVIAVRPLANVLAPALAAQVATAPISVAIFGQLPVVALAANCVATPVAGVVMLVGLPIALISAYLPDAAAHTAMAPLEAMVRVVWWTATLAERSSPRGMWNVGAWVAVVSVIAWRACHSSPTSEPGDRVVATYVNGRLSSHR